MGDVQDWMTTGVSGLDAAGAVTWVLSCARRSDGCRGPRMRGGGAGRSDMVVRRRWAGVSSCLGGQMPCHCLNCRMIPGDQRWHGKPQPAGEVAGDLDRLDGVETQLREWN